MKPYQLTITARGPLAFSRRKPGTQFRESLPYVPGRALFGALGQALDGDGRFDVTQMRALRCHNAYPAHPGDSQVRPLPATAQGEKHADTDVHDTLIARLCWEQQHPPALLFAPTDQDGNPWDARRGFYTLHAGRVAPRQEPQQRVITRVGINRRRGTAEEGQLFSPLVLSEVQPRSGHPGMSHEPEERAMPTTFCGSIVLPENQDDLLETVTALHWLGGRVSTGIGQVEVQCSAPPEERPLQQRIDDLTTRCKEQAEVYAQLGGVAWHITGSIFTVNLLSDTILLEQGWLPTMVLTGDMLSTATHGTITATLLRSFASYDYDGGWQVCWQRPKATHVVARMGSLYVFATADPLTSDQVKALEHLQLVGIGERVQEGFGQVRICDEFHLQEGVRL